jgi:hypothetical protein
MTWSEPPGIACSRLQVHAEFLNILPTFDLVPEQWHCLVSPQAANVGCRVAKQCGATWRARRELLNMAGRRR